jgi:predicted small secreted protein
MRWVKTLSIAAVLACSPWVAACPNCKDAIANGTGEDGDDPLREARAYNNSIYFMLAVPYSILGIGGFVFYRHYRTGQPTNPPSE